MSERDYQLGMHVHNSLSLLVKIIEVYNLQFYSPLLKMTQVDITTYSYSLIFIYWS